MSAKDYEIHKQCLECNGTGLWTDAKGTCHNCDGMTHRTIGDWMARAHEHVAALHLPQGSIMFWKWDSAHSRLRQIFESPRDWIAATKASNGASFLEAGSGFEAAAIHKLGENIVAAGAIK